jgi:hypothetical protein
MNDIGDQYAVATLQLSQRREKLEGQQAVRLIEGAGGAGGGGNAPPPQPVSVTPRAGSTVEVVA